MLSGLAQAGMRALGGARFSLVNLMPAAFLVGFLTILAVSGLYDGGDFDVGEVAEKLGGNGGWAIVAVFGVFLMAVLLRPFQVALVQFLEGYWPHWAVLNHVVELAIERHRRVRQTAEVIWLTEPKPNLPTTNALRDVAEVQRHWQRVAAIRMRASATLARYPHPLLERNEDGRIDYYEDRLMPTLLGNALRDGEDNAGQRYGLVAEMK